MLAFENGAIRRVVIPDWTLVEDILGEAYRLGQNDFQKDPSHCSVSVGDVIEHDGGYHLVKSFGFQKMSKEEMEAYRKLSQRDRIIQATFT
jgi:hypothetical protein